MSEEATDRRNEPEKPIFDDYGKENSDFMKDPTDFSDPVAEERRKKRIKTIALSALAIIFVAALVYGTYYLMTKDNKPDAAPKSTPTQTVSSEQASQVAAKNPLGKLYPNTAKVEEGQVTVSVNKDGIAASSDGNTLKAKEGKLQSASDPCTLSQGDEFCLVASGNNKKQSYDVYYLRDAANSRLFENPKNFQKTTLSGAAAAATLKMSIGDKEFPALATLNRNSSGWMVIFKNGNASPIFTAS